MTEIASLGHPLSIKYLIQYLDDSSAHAVVLFNIVHAIETFNKNIYIGKLLPLLPEFIKCSPVWAEIIHERILSDIEATDIYKERLWHTKDYTRVAIKKFLRSFKESKPEFNSQCDILLSTIKKKELKSFQLPLDTDRFKLRLEKACIDSFLKTNTDHLGEHLCGFGLYCDSNSLSIVPSVNTQAYLHQTTEKERDAIQWCPELWIYSGENGCFFNDLSEQLASKIQHFTTDDEKEYFKLSIYELCVSVLESMRTHGFFKPDSIVAFAELGSQRGSHDIEWMEQLNLQGIKPFIQWIDQSQPLHEEGSSTSLQTTDVVVT